MVTLGPGLRVDLKPDAGHRAPKEAAPRHGATHVAGGVWEPAPGTAATEPPEVRVFRSDARVCSFKWDHIQETAPHL